MSPRIEDFLPHQLANVPLIVAPNEAIAQIKLDIDLLISGFKVTIDSGVSLVSNGFRNVTNTISVAAEDSKNLVESVTFAPLRNMATSVKGMGDKIR